MHLTPLFAQLAGSNIGTIVVAAIAMTLSAGYLQWRR